jgi:hypothetical protein
MGCASSVNVQIEDNKDNRKILTNGKEVENIKLNNNDKLEEKFEENLDEKYLDEPTIKQTNNEENKTISNTNKISNKQNIRINDNYYNKSTNFKYLKETKINLIKSNPLMKDNNKAKEKAKNKYIPLKHPLDISSEKNISEFNKLKKLNISEEKENDNKEGKDFNHIKDNNELMNSIEERINNYNGNNNNLNYWDDDGVNMGNYEVGDNDDMCNFGQSMDFDNLKNKENQDVNEVKEICVIFEIQSTGVKYYINIKENAKLIELIELFKKKIQISTFEKPEFVFNTVFLVDFEKPIADYKICDNSKINVFI